MWKNAPTRDAVYQRRFLQFPRHRMKVARTKTTKNGMILAVAR